MATLAAFRRLLQQSVTVRSPTVELTEFGNPKTTAFSETADSPLDMAVQPAGSGGAEDPFFGVYPSQTHVGYYAVGATLATGYLLSWTDAASNTVWADVEGPPEDEAGRGHHYRVSLRQRELPPSGVT